MSLASAAADLWTRWEPPSEDQASLREAYLTTLGSAPTALWRAHAPGHFTASAIVLSPDLRHVLLVLHPRARAWLPPGGHLEPEDHSVSGAALREVREETGLSDFSDDPVLTRLDAHPFRCSLGVPTRHLDSCFGLVARPGPGGGPPTPVISEESEDLRWWPVEALPIDRMGTRVPTAIAVALAAVGTRPLG